MELNYYVYLALNISITVNVKMFSKMVNLIQSDDKLNVLAIKLYVIINIVLISVLIAKSATLLQN